MPVKKYIKKNNKNKKVDTKIDIKKVLEKVNINYEKVYAPICDMLYKENLMCIYDSFGEIPIQYLVYIDNKLWDIRLLLDQWSQLLCATEMQNSSPVYPSNPYTRKNINQEDIKNILKSLKINKLKVYTPLRYFFENYNKISMSVNYNTDYELKKQLINLLEEKFRFRLLNNKNSQDAYTGIWVDKYEKLSDFEIFYDYYDKMPMQIQTPYGGPIDNYEKIEVKKLLDKYPKENINLETFSL
jgi:hypothetical protein